MNTSRLPVLMEAGAVMDRGDDPETAAELDT
jgi:hypothetical protein